MLARIAGAFEVTFSDLLRDVKLVSSPARSALRRTIETYHGYILDSQQVLTMVDVAETIEEPSAKDAVKEQIILAVRKVRSTVGRDSGKVRKVTDNTNP